MKTVLGVAAFAVAMGVSAAYAAESGCGETLRVSVAPADRAGDAAAVLRRRLIAAGDEAPEVAMDGGGLKVGLPAGLPDSLVTRPARIEMRLVANKPDDPGAVALPKLGGGEEKVEPQIILDEGRLRNLKVRTEPDPQGGAPIVALTFHIEPLGAKNLMAASAESIGRRLAIIVDDRIVAEPEIRAPIASINGEISGGLTQQSAKELVDLLASGRLPAHLAILERKPAPCPAR